MSRPTCQVHPSGGCPPLCRHQARVAHQPVLEVLGEWRQNFLHLKWVLDAMGPPAVIDEDTSDEFHIDRVVAVYRSHGWPEDFHAAQCRKALDEMPNDDEDDEDSDED